MAGLFRAFSLPQAHRYRWLRTHLLSTIPVLFIITAFSFFTLDCLPGNAAQQLIGIGGTPEQIQALETKLGVDKPGPERYMQWLASAIRGDFGVSLASNQRVSQIVRERLPVTFELVAIALVLALLTALPSAVICVRYADRFFDRMLLTLSMASLSIPSYVLALVLVLLFSIHWRLFPAIGFKPISVGLWANLRGLVLPASALAAPLAGLYSRFLRADLLQKLSQEEYMFTAVAKGLGPWKVISRHGLRNSIAGLITLVCMNIGMLLGATVVIERLFALPGLGSLLLQSVVNRDAPMVQAIVVLLGTATLGANLLCDILIGIADPRPERGLSN